MAEITQVRILAGTISLEKFLKLHWQLLSAKERFKEQFMTVETRHCVVGAITQVVAEITQAQQQFQNWTRQILKSIGPDRILVSTLRCARNNRDSHPGLDKFLGTVF